MSECELQSEVAWQRRLACRPQGAIRCTHRTLRQTVAAVFGRGARRRAGLVAESAAVSTQPAMPRFVLLPGLDGTGDLLQAFAALLQQLGPVEVIAYPSEPVAGYTTLLEQLAARVTVDADTVLLAESFAGPLGIALVAQAAVAPRALVLCATFADSPLPWLRPLAPLLRGLPLHGLPPWLCAAATFGRWATPAWSARLHATLHQVPQPVLRERLRAALRVDWREALSGVRCPLLYLQASADCIVPARSARRIAAPHFLLQVAPEAALAAIAAFLANTVAR